MEQNLEELLIKTMKPFVLKRRPNEAELNKGMGLDNPILGNIKNWPRKFLRTTPCYNLAFGPSHVFSFGGGAYLLL